MFDKLAENQRLVFVFEQLLQRFAEQVELAAAERNVFVDQPRVTGRQSKPRRRTR